MQVIKSLRICEIVTFDFGCKFSNDDERKKIKYEFHNKFAPKEIIDEELNINIYDFEFIRINETKKPILISGTITGNNFENIINSYKKNLNANSLRYFLVLEKYFLQKELEFKIALEFYGIGTLKVEFNLKDDKEHLDVINIIESIMAAGQFVDEYLFSSYFREKINICFSNSLRKRVFPTLREQHTYSIIMTNSEYKFKKNEIYGIVWKDKNYETVNKNIVDKITRNIAIETKDEFIISQPATFLKILNKNYEDDYFQNRINALEILRRQHHLLKKFDIKLSELIEKKKEKNLSKVINEIIEMQDNIFLYSEFYKNLKAFAMQEYVYIFERANQVFRIQQLYESLCLKLEYSYNVVSDLIQEKRNIILENLQYVGFFFASIVFVTTIFHPLCLRLLKELNWLKKIGFIIRPYQVPLLDLLASILFTFFGIFAVKLSLQFKTRFKKND